MSTYKNVSTSQRNSAKLVLSTRSAVCVSRPEHLDIAVAELCFQFGRFDHADCFDGSACFSSVSSDPWYSKRRTFGAIGAIAHPFFSSSWASLSVCIMLRVEVTALHNHERVAVTMVGFC